MTREDRWKIYRGRYKKQSTGRPLGRPRIHPKKDPNVKRPKGRPRGTAQKKIVKIRDPFEDNEITFEQPEIRVRNKKIKELGRQLEIDKVNKGLYQTEYEKRIRELDQELTYRDWKKVMGDPDEIA